MRKSKKKEPVLNKLLNLSFQILWKMTVGLIRLPVSNPVEILIFLVCMVILYLSIAAYNYNLGLIASITILTYLLNKGRNKKK
jgi:hypothetical protein